MVDFYEFVHCGVCLPTPKANTPSTYVLDIIPSNSSKNFLSCSFGPLSQIINSLPPTPSTGPFLSVYKRVFMTLTCPVQEAGKSRPPSPWTFLGRYFPENCGLLVLHSLHYTQQPERAFESTDQITSRYGLNSSQSSHHSWNASQGPYPHLQGPRDLALLPGSAPPACNQAKLLPLQGWSRSALPRLNGRFTSRTVWLRHPHYSALSFKFSPNPVSPGISTHYIFQLL